MKYIHVRNIDKYHPGYKDRQLHWAKINFAMVQGDPDCELIDNEIDWARLIKFIILELQAKKPIPLETNYLQKKGFDLKKRPIDLTLRMLHNFLDTVTQDSKVCVLEESRVEKKREEKNRIKYIKIPPKREDVCEFINSNNFNVDADTWFNFYESKGWLIGKNRMKDWKAAVRTWANHRKEKNERQQFEPAF